MWLLWVLAGVAFGTNPLDYLPGVNPRSWSARERLPLLVSQVTSTKTQIPYDYYALPYCGKPKKKMASGRSSSSAGSLERSAPQPSSYELLLKVPDACKLLCRKEHNRAELRLYRAMIENDYRVGWSVDGLPAAMRTTEGYASRGFPVGFWTLGDQERQDGEDSPKRKHYVYNHHRLTVSYHEDPKRFEGARIVGLEVEPFSIHHDYDRSTALGSDTVLDLCNEMRPAQHDPANLQSVDGSSAEIIYTYDVKWVPSSTPWARRWEAYVRADPDDEIHYFSIVNSLMIVLFLTGVVAMIMLRTLRRDISTYNENAALEDAQEESGWKLLHADVFRPPKHAFLLAVCVATGAQILVMTLAVMSLALLGFFAPARERRGLAAAVVALFVSTAAVAGYVAAALNNILRVADARSLMLATAIAYPALVAAIVFSLESLLRAQGASSRTFPVAAVFSLFGLLLFVSTPLVFAGAALGASRRLDPPTRVAAAPRDLPPRLWYTHPLFAVAFGGVLPFGAVCIELFFIMSALWLDQIYYVFGFLVVVLVILVATCAEMTIVLTYFQLCNENYHWWWRSFFSSASAAAYLFLYAVWYFNAKLDIHGLVPATLYFAYMGLVAATFALLCGAIGFAAALAFVLKIYAAIKID